MPDQPRISRRTAQVDSETVSFLEGGQGPALLFLHSFGASGDLWRHQLDAFALDHRVIAPDLRGHGGTSWEGGLKPAQMAFDAAGLCRELGCESAVVIGLSMGVLASAFTSPSPRLQEVLSGVAMEAELVIDMKDYARRRAERMLAAGGADEGFLAGAGRMSKAVLSGLGRSLAHWNATPLLKAVGVPVLLLVGENDPYVSLGMAEEIAGRLRQAEVVTIPGAGHICNLDAPEAFEGEMRRFLARLSAPQPPSS